MAISLLLLVCALQGSAALVLFTRPTLQPTQPTRPTRLAGVRVTMDERDQETKDEDDALAVRHQRLERVLC